MGTLKIVQRAFFIFALSLVTNNMNHQMFLKLPRTGCLPSVMLLSMTKSTSWRTL